MPVTGPIHSKISLNPRYYSKCYISVTTHPRSDLLKTLNENWFQDFFRVFPTSPLELSVLQEMPPQWKNISRIVPLTGNEKDLYDTMLPRRLAQFKAFLFEYPGINWFLTTSDDSYVYIDRLKDYLDELGKTVDPRTTPIFKGQVSKPPWGDGYFVQGGAGWIFSRKSIEIIFRNWIKLERNAPTTVDDVFILETLKYLNLAVEDVHEPRFNGIDFNDLDVIKIHTHNYTGVPECLEVIPKPIPFWNKNVAVNDLVVWHASWRSQYFAVKGGWNDALTVPSHFRTFYLGGMSTLCQNTSVKNMNSS